MSGLILLTELFDKLRLEDILVQKLTALFSLSDQIL